MASHEYYYSKDGEDPVGPFNIIELIERINRDYLVWREGIEWTNAYEVPELSKFFPDAGTRLQSVSKGKPAENLDAQITQVLDYLRATWASNNSLYFRGNFDHRKWGNFTSQYRSDAVGSIDDCLVYFDDTVFGKGDDGFMFTKRSFLWENAFQQLHHTSNHQKVPGFVPASETVRFSTGTANSFVVCNKASEHLVNGGFNVTVTKLKSPSLIVEPFNRLLYLCKRISESN